MVIEAVFEDLAVKKQVFAECEEVVSPECLLLTNTSSLSVSEMAADLAHPERVVGFHFFNPVAVLPLLEVVAGRQTDDVSLKTAFDIAKKLKKTAVRCSDAPAFVVNRVLTRFLGEVTRAVDEGTSFEDADRALEPLGLPMSPFVLLALVGPGVALHVAETMHEAFPDRYHLSDNLRRMVEAGKTGVYTWEGGQQVVDPEVRDMFVKVGDGPAPTVEEVRARALDAPRRRDPPDARRRCRGRGPGRRPVHDHGRGLAVPPGRHHPVPGPGGRVRARVRRALPPAGSGDAAGLTHRALRPLRASSGPLRPR